MKAIIAGSRYAGVDTKIIYKKVVKAIEFSGYEITEVVSGGCSGVDRCGEFWGRNNGKPITKFLAQWSLYGKMAGPIRNAAMAKYADALIAVWDEKSTGTKSMIECAKRAGLKVFVFVTAARES